jgi:hypothetical protein
MGLHQGIQVRQRLQVGRAGVAALRRHRQPGVGQVGDHLPIFRPGQQLPPLFSHLP